MLDGVEPEGGVDAILITMKLDGNYLLSELGYFHKAIQLADDSVGA